MRTSMMQKMGGFLIIPFVMGLLMSDDSLAADKKDKAAKRNAQMMQKMRQEFEAEKVSMQAQFDLQKQELEKKLSEQATLVTETQEKLDTSEQALRKTSATLKATSGELATSKTNLANTQAELDTTKNSLGELKTQHQKALADLAFNDTQRKTLVTNLSETTRQLNACEVKNEKLYQYGKELVKLYDSPSQYEEAMRNEKFFQLKRVELENIFQDTLDKLDEARVGSKSKNY